MLDTVKSFLEKYSLLQPDIKLLLAFSGGYDSLCLLDILKKLNANVTAIHLNHNWRGAESLCDENNCREFCKKNNIDFYCEMPPDNIPKTETAARNARYDFFEKCAKKFKAQAVLTAHNANDNAETIIYRIAKGTGITGLCGIAEKRGIFYRPLLNIKRKSIENYCHKNNLTPNIDSSNENTNYRRNYIRYEILPKLERINEDAVDMLNSLALNAQNDNEIINEYLQTIKDPYLTENFVKLSNPVQMRLIYNLFVDYCIDYSKDKIRKTLEFIKQNTASKSGKYYSLTENFFIFVINKKIEVIRTSENTDICIKIDKEGDYACDRASFSIKRADGIFENFPKDEEMTAFVQIDDLKSLTLRSRRPGDFIYPLNSGGKQKLKKYLNEKKIAKHIKDKMLFLAQNSEILWAPGLGISDKIKVATNATHVLKFTYR